MSMLPESMFSVHSMRNVNEVWKVNTEEASGRRFVTHPTQKERIRQQAMAVLFKRSFMEDSADKKCPARVSLLVTKGMYVWLESTASTHIK